MNITQIEQKLKIVLQDVAQEQENYKEKFIYEFLLAFGLPKASISRLQKSSLNLATNVVRLKNTNSVLWKNRLCFQEVKGDTELLYAVEQIKTDQQIMKYNPRFVIVTNYIQFVAVDTKTIKTLEINLSDLLQYFQFFLPWVGIEETVYHSENIADVKAAERMAKFFDEIKKDNPELSAHELNLFLSRLLFCLFADDTGIFETKLFTKAIHGYTQDDGSDLHQYLEHIFAVMNVDLKNRQSNLSSTVNIFPYVNGGLFKDISLIPKFSKKSRQLLLDSGDLNWADINPDIFGSMIQAVVDAKSRSSLGMHYTSVPNIMKLINPLFLNELNNEYEQNKDSKSKLDKLRKRISNIKIFDPACGSGNFLIIAYKELRKLEIKILKTIDELTQKPSMQFSEISLTNFYGIEIDDFAHEIAKLSLWLAEHQMNRKFDEELGVKPQALPLKQSGHIVCANACRIAWEEVCPKGVDDEIYVLGNPPYLGAKMQSYSQKCDFESVFQAQKYPRNLDYISCWFITGSKYITGHEKIKLAFVSTNSICQGDHVGLLWPIIFAENIQIDFAYTSFKWNNQAKYNAGVTCIIVGLANVNSNKKILYTENSELIATNINPYLVASDKNTIVYKINHSISNLPDMVFGSMARDGGHLLLNADDKNAIIAQDSKAQKMIKELLGSQEFIRGEKKYCLWIEDDSLETALQIENIKKRLEQVTAFRKNSPADSTKEYANRPHLFVQRSYKPIDAIFVPSVSSERRKYIPIGFLDKDTVIVAPNFAIYDPETWVFAVISSRMHMTWVRAVAGRLETRIRYSSTLCYNTFPFPTISQEQKEMLTFHVHQVLSEREDHYEKTLAEIYDPDKMPSGLRIAHEYLDLAIDSCYSQQPFSSDEERLEYLFKMYEKMVGETKIIALSNDVYPV